MGVTNFIKHCQVENKVFLINYCVMHPSPPPPFLSPFTAIRISIEKAAIFFLVSYPVSFFYASIQITKLFGLTHCSGDTKYSLFVEFQLVTAKVNYIAIYCSKDKGQPRTGHESPEGEYGYSYPLSLIPALDRGGWSTPRPGRLTPGKDPVPIV